MHRDISPSNLLLTFDGRLKIIDFGIALVRDREAPRTALGVLRGNLNYLSPEQIQQDRIDRRSDIFSASVVLHELLTGTRLFQGNAPGAVYTQIIKGKIARPSRTVSSIPRALDKVVLKGLSRDVEKR